MPCRTKCKATLGTAKSMRTGPPSLGPPWLVTWTRPASRPTFGGMNVAPFCIHSLTSDSPTHRDTPSRTRAVGHRSPRRPHEGRGCEIQAARGHGSTRGGERHSAAALASVLFGAARPELVGG